VEPSQKARFLASVTPHSGDWLLALPIANCGFRLGDEAVRVAVSMRRGLALCAPHSCPRGDQVDAQVELPDTASIPATKDQSGLVRQDGERPDGLILIPWQGESRWLGMSLLSARWHSRTLMGQPLVWE